MKRTRRMRRARAWVLATALPSFGCWSQEDKAPPPPVQLLEVTPDRDVPLDGTVRLRFSGAVQPRGTSAWPIQVRRGDGRTVPITVEPAADGAELTLRPESHWPPAERLSIVIDPLADALGRKVVAPQMAPSFTTRGVSGPPLLTLRSPLPGRVVPPNVKQVTVSVVPQAVAGQTRLILRSSSDTVIAPITEAHEDQLRAELPERSDGICERLCPDQRYQLELEGGSSALSAALAEIRTGTASDEVPPELRLLRVDRRGGQVSFLLSASEPVWAHGVLWPPEGDPIRLAGELVASVTPRVHSEATVADDADCAVALAAEDLAGNPAEALVFRVATPPAAEVRLSEVVFSPRHDWNDSAPEGERFDAWPGSGTVSDADEWIELVNLSTFAVDLESTGLMLRIIDGTPTETSLAAAPALSFAAGGSLHRWLPGEALVVHPRGSMAQEDLTVEVLSGDQVLDRVVFASTPDADHAGGRPPDLSHEAVARDRNGSWRWCVPTPGDPAPNPECLQ